LLKNKYNFYFGGGSVSKKRNLVLFIASSLDGYIATKDDSLEWLFNIEGEGDNGFTEFYETVDTVLLGKRTYDWLMKQDIEEYPYKDKECYVFTRSSMEDTKDVKFINEDVTKFIDKLKNQDGKNIWIVGGGELLHDFMKEKLVDELIITLAPTILGSGIPLFKEGDYQIDLTLKRMRNFNQFAELHYVIKNQ
jgi:dihydrofolate reductase